MPGPGAWNLYPLPVPGTFTPIRCLEPFGLWVPGTEARFGTWHLLGDLVPGTFVHLSEFLVRYGGHLVGELSDESWGTDRDRRFAIAIEEIDFRLHPALNERSMAFPTAGGLQE